ncbi:MAG TPA: hypothetical protein VGM07_03070 [Stellaceae bacterium]|jgi:hypothetical protein
MSKIPQGEWSAIAARYQNGESISKIARGYGCTPPAIHYILKRHRQSVATADRPPAEGQTAAAVGNAVAASSAPLLVKCDRAETAPVRMHTPAAARPSPPRDQYPVAHPLADWPTNHPRAAATPGLDSDLHDRAEAAIEVFRTSFNAALTEASPSVRERLRQAAADLMRVAARTTIVLDRLNASAERAARAPDYPRSAHMR